ncbi:MAG: DNA-3-methyladenine glycosylase 2 family protein [bacterium]|nr:DNA-3-methyladenine glycosylase 2 family protein [bacterium]
MIAVTDREIFFQAMLSRDRRFDGRFFVAVTTTGIYCRPICPAPKPKLENVQFFPTAAGAETRGFRPCKRCRPDASPGTPVWSGTSATVSRALQMIDNGFLDEQGVGQLGETLGVGERQLRRLFKDHLGAPPHSVALTRRLDFARKLIDETNLSMTDIAFASGFESIRRFNDAVKKRFERSPSDLRKAARTPGAEQTGKNRLTLLLPFRPPLDWPVLLGYLKGRQIDGVEVIENNCYCRSIGSGGHYGAIKVTPSRKDGHLELTLQIDDTKGLMLIVRRVRRIFDLEADPMFVARHLMKDPGLSPIISSFPGLRVPGGWDNFEIAVRTVIGQQISIPGANTITRRLVQRCGTELNPSPLEGITHLFPTPAAIASADLSGLGIPGKRAKTITMLAEKVADGDIVLEGNVQPETVKRRLMEIPGIGQWTTEYIAMRALREPDAFPGTDLAIKRELEEIGPGPSAGTRLQTGGRPDVWRPWRSYAAMYLWKNYGTRMNNK